MQLAQQSAWQLSSSRAAFIVTLTLGSGKTIQEEIELDIVE